MRNHPSVFDRANQFFEQEIKPALANIYGGEIRHDLNHSRQMLDQMMQRKARLELELHLLRLDIRLAQLEIRDAEKKA